MSRKVSGSQQRAETTQLPLGATGYELVQAHAAESLILEIVEKTWGIDIKKSGGQSTVPRVLPLDTTGQQITAFG